MFPTHFDLSLQIVSHLTRALVNYNHLLSARFSRAFV